MEEVETTTERIQVVERMEEEDQEETMMWRKKNANAPFMRQVIRKQLEEMDPVEEENTRTWELMEKEPGKDPKEMNDMKM